MPPFLRCHAWAATALALAFVAIACCAAATGVGYRDEPGLFDLGRNHDGNRLGPGLRVAGGALAFIGIVLASIAWIRREHIRIWSAALALSVIALAWEYALLGVCFALMLLLLGSLLSAS